jgi:hypothetical protein
MSWMTTVQSFIIMRWKPYDISSIHLDRLKNPWTLQTAHKSCWNWSLVSSKCNFKFPRYFPQRTWKQATSYLTVGLLLDLLFNLRDGCDVFLRNIRFSPNYIALQPTRPHSNWSKIFNQVLYSSFSNAGMVMWDFVMDKSGAGAGFLRELRFPLPIYISYASPQSSSLSPEAGIIGQEWTQCQ